MRLVLSSDFHRGVEVVLAAQEATGLPATLTPAELSVQLAERQQQAAGVWLAYDATGRAVGHALVTLVDNTHTTWGPVADPEVAAARATGELAELGGLAVHPSYVRRGVAGTLQSARLTWCASRGLFPVAAAWDSSVGSTTLCRRMGRPVGTHHQYPITLYRLDGTHPTRVDGTHD